MTRHQPLPPSTRTSHFVDRRDHLHQPVLHGRLDTEATKLATGLHLYLAEAIWIHVARMWIEPGEHAVDR